ncbi:MAG: hypothetical protein JO121_04400 [Deltaproteobacteria bacterium]|nr:hypothetical protein [Deltaproteobacteria bacterium]
MKQKRGPWLTIFAIGYILLAISDMLKPYQQTRSPGVGLVFFGHKLTATANLIIAPLFGIFFVIYAIGIWRMKRYALPMSLAYAVYAVLNPLLFNFVFHGSNGSSNPIVLMIVYAVGLAVPIATAVILTQRRAELT